MDSDEGQDVQGGGPKKQAALVLYVDDDRANRVVFEQTLSEDFTLECVADAKTALAVMAEREVAVLVTDMRMPAMSGEELVRIVKERYPRTIRIVITAYSDVDPILRAINEGLVARYIIKPWVQAELIQVLRWATEAWTFSHDSAELHHRLLETERLAMLGSIAGAIAHDMATPMQSLQYNSDRLRELAKSVPALGRLATSQPLEPREWRQVDDLLDELAPVSNDIGDALAQVRGLRAQLMQYNKLGRGDATAIPPRTDPLPIVRHAVAICGGPHHLTHLIKYEGPSELPPVRIAAVELSQVLINIVANAVRAVQARGGTDRTIAIRARQDNGVLELEVRDDGVGIPPEVLARIGTPFLTTREGGTGLGISQCQRLLGSAGGRLQIDSAPGVGTTVTITIPVAA